MTFYSVKNVVLNGTTQMKKNVQFLKTLNMIIRRRRKLMKMHRWVLHQFAGTVEKRAIWI